MTAAPVAPRAEPARGDRGQAAVELALVLPLVVVLLVAIVQVGVVVRDQILVVHAAREAAREVAVQERGKGPPALEVARRAAAAATGRTLRPDRLTLSVEHRGGRVAVRAGYRSRIWLPVVRLLARDVPLVANAQVRAEK